MGPSCRRIPLGASGDIFMLLTRKGERTSTSADIHPLGLVTRTCFRLFWPSSFKEKNLKFARPPALSPVTFQPITPQDVAFRTETPSAGDDVGHRTVPRLREQRHPARFQLRWICEGLHGFCEPCSQGVHIGVQGGPIVLAGRLLQPDFASNGLQE